MFANDPWLSAVWRMGGTSMRQSKALTRMRQMALRSCYGKLTEELMRLIEILTLCGVFGHGSLWKIEQK